MHIDWPFVWHSYKDLTWFDQCVGNNFLLLLFTLSVKLTLCNNYTKCSLTPSLINVQLIFITLIKDDSYLTYKWAYSLMLYTGRLITSKTLTHELTVLYTVCTCSYNVLSHHVLNMYKLSTNVWMDYDFSLISSGGKNKK